MPLNLLVVSFLAALVMSATIYYLLASMGVVGVGPSALVGLTIGVGLSACPCWSTTCSSSATTP